MSEATMHGAATNAEDYTRPNNHDREAVPLVLLLKQMFSGDLVAGVVIAILRFWVHPIFFSCDASFPEVQGRY
jgi:hypothetical protein